jgi:hypothetical protein
MSYADLKEAMRLLTRPLAREKPPEKFRAASALARAAARRWLEDAGVLGFGIGPRVTDGKVTRDLALRVHVLKKLPLSRLGRQRIPPVVRMPGMKGPVAIDVIESELPRAELALVGDGVTLSGPVPEFGTIGFVAARGGTADHFAVTCRHVLDGKAGAPVEWAEFPPAPALPNPIIGTLAFKSGFSAGGNFPNFTDIALVRLAAGAVSPAVRGLGKIAGIRTSELKVGETVRLCGFGTSLLAAGSFGVTEGQVVEPKSNRIIALTNHGDLGFRDVVVCTRFTSPRDSGAGVLDAQNRLVGIHMAGAAGAGGFSIFQRIGNVLSAFDLSMPSSTRAPATAPEAHALGATQGRAPPAVGERAVAIDVLARTLWGEARGEPARGKHGVANVILNRVAKRKPKRFGATVEEVCRKPLQFSCWNANDPNLPKLKSVTDSDARFRECLEIARIAVNGALVDNTVGSDHYHTIQISPAWAAGLAPAVTIENHHFYNNVP